jgi:hypothetical protein
MQLITLHVCGVDPVGDDASYYAQFTLILS